MITEFVISAGEKRKRLDTFLVHREPEISRSGLQRLILLGRIRVNAHVVKPSQKIKPGDRITIDTPQASSTEFEEKSIVCEILHEDEVLLVVNKPTGIVMHPTAGNWSGTLVNYILAYFQNTQQGSLTPGIVHRLDKDTSGLIVVAKNKDAHRALSNQFEKHTITRHYEALAWKVPAKNHGMINLAIGRDTHESKKHSPNTENPRAAMTEYYVVKRWRDVASHIRLSPHTGRTHQLRVHLASLGFPILGDTLYGGDKVGQIEEIEIPRIMLHACILGFQHPTLGVYQEYTIDCPSDMQTIGKKLEHIANPIRL